MVFLKIFFKKLGDVLENSYEFGIFLHLDFCIAQFCIINSVFSIIFKKLFEDFFFYS